MAEMTRRNLLGTATLGAASSSMQPKSPPNVILILGDDLGYADLGCYGQKLIQTPNLDALAAEGLQFRQAYSGSTVCAPSRCCLMTGKHTGHGTVRGNAEPHVPLRADEPTIAELFKKAGYRTGAFGKWGLGTPPDTHALPTRKGFDRFYGYLHQVHAQTYYPDMLWNNERESYLAQKDEVEIRYAVPNHPRGESSRFCHLRKDYFEDVVEALSLAQGNPARQRAVRLQRFACGRIDRILIHIDDPRPRVLSCRENPAEEAFGSFSVALCREQEIDGLAG